MQSKRAVLAVIIVALWLGGMAMMFRRNATRSEAQQLTEVALRLQPATFYYVVERDGQQIGAASSAVDTTVNTLISEEYFVGDYPTAKSVERTSARWQTRLTRGFRLADLTVDIARQTRPFSINASVEEDTLLFIAGTKTTGGHPPARYTFTPPLFTPSLAPVAFMLSGPHTIGRKQKKALGAASYLQKPYAIDRVVMTIERILGEVRAKTASELEMLLNVSREKIRV